MLIIFSYVCWPFVYHLGRNVFKSFAHFLVKFFFFFIELWEFFILLDINPLSSILFANIFSCCPFSLLIVSWETDDRRTDSCLYRRNASCKGWHCAKFFISPSIHEAGRQQGQWLWSRINLGSNQTIKVQTNWAVYLVQATYPLQASIPFFKTETVVPTLRAYMRI